MKEKFSLKSIIGGTPEQKGGAMNELNERFDTQMSAVEKWRDVEVEKTPEIIRCIEVANQAVLHVLHTYGVEVDALAHDKIHAINDEHWPDRLRDTGAFFSLVDQCIVVPDNRRPIQLATFLSHELLHFYSYQAVQFMPDGLATNYRTGFSVESRDGQTSFFEEINEAITETLARECFYTETFQAAFAKELEETKQTITEHPDALDSGNDTSLFTDQTYYATVGERFNDGSVNILTEQFVYQDQREGFALLCGKLHEKNADQYSSADEVKQAFVQATISGNLLTMGKLIEKTFGKGVFRKLSKHESGRHFLDFVKSLG